MSPSTRVMFRFGLAAALLLAVVAYAFERRRTEPDRAIAEARASVAFGDPAAALDKIARAERFPAVAREAGLLRVERLVEMDRPREAAAALDAVGEAEPFKGRHAYWKGRILMKAGQPLLAEVWLKTACEHLPSDADAARWLGAAAYEVGDRPVAVSALRRAGELDPKDPRVRRTLGAIYRENEEHELACVAYDASLKIDRAQPAVRLEYAECLLKVGRSVEAEAQLDECEGFVPEGRRAELLAEALLSRGEVEKSRAVVEAGLKADPDCPGLRLVEAKRLLAERHETEALASLDRVVAAEPGRSEALYLRGRTLRSLGREADAKRDLDRAEEISRAVQELSKLDDQAAKAPTDPEIRFKLGRACLDLGKRQLAASWFRAALACDPKHEGAALALADLRRAGVTP